jgi:hypothetical protein
MEDDVQQPEPGYRRLLEVRRGNMIGVIDEPDMPGGVPENRREDLWQVKIGIIDVNVALTAPFSKDDAEAVVKGLADFLKKKGFR